MKFAAFLLAASTLDAQQYFPPDAFDSTTAELYSKYLRALTEPSLRELSQKDPSAEVYRFLWLRAFHRPIAVRLTVTGSGGRVISKMTSARGGYDPGHLIRNRERSLSERDPNFAGAIEELHFWALPARAPEVIAPDG